MLRQCGAQEVRRKLAQELSEQKPYTVGLVLGTLGRQGSTKILDNLK